jgi:hypothetical protein
VDNKGMMWKWQMEAKHRKSKVCGEENVAMLKVSFFGLFMGV